MPNAAPTATGNDTMPPTMAATNALMVRRRSRLGSELTTSDARLYNITPDLTTLGKIIGGGMPVGGVGGSGW